MKFLIVSNAPIIYKDDKAYAYSPYVKELEIWIKYADEIAFCCPVWEKDNGLLVSEIPFSSSKLFKLSDFNVKSLLSLIKAFLQIVYNFVVIFRAMFWADHIHLRCPGNAGLLASLVQLLFPHKIKTAKYAGNWDPKASQPLSYRLQKWILNNTFLTRNMQVLVYGEWDGSSKNIKPFFTATYRESDKKEIPVRDLNQEIRWMFVGTLSVGKRPFYALQLFHSLLPFNEKMRFDFYGEGIERKKLEEYITIHQLEDKVTLHGNQTKEFVEKAYQNNHFLILPSKSEGWPKVVAEAMFWGCVPIVSPVSCVRYMLDDDNRGILLTMDLNKDIEQLQQCITDKNDYSSKAIRGMEWSRHYTLDYFEEEIKELLLGNQKNT